VKCISGDICASGIRIGCSTFGWTILAEFALFIFPHFSNMERKRGKMNCAIIQLNPYRVKKFI